MRWFFFFFSAVIFLGCTTVGVKDLASSEEKKSEAEQKQANANSSEEKIPLNPIHHSSTASHTNYSETSSGNNLSSHSNSSSASEWETIVPDRKPSSLEVLCWNCKGIVKEFICSAQIYNREDLPPGISYYCKIGRLTHHDEKAKEGEKDTDKGLCPQCRGTRRSICWICKGKGKVLQK